MKTTIGERNFVAITITVLALFLVSNLNANAKPNIDQQLRSGIAKVRRARTVSRRLDAAEHLVALTDNCDCSAVTDKTIHSLVSLLDIDDDGVRMWVAAALGDIGIRGKEAVPKLLNIFSGSACAISDRGSAATIPIALAKMGIAVPSPNCSLR